MEETHKLDLRPVLVVLAVAFAAAAIWAATALGAGGTSSSSDSASTGDAAYEYMQTQDDGEDAAPSAEDCPERDGGSGGSEDGTSTSTNL